ncbi:MAG: PD40 domain-containing protein [Anaerolineales bacterium]|nr:PD40 domain-containing protein [Anaerolineales bacterium]
MKPSDISSVQKPFCLLLLLGFCLILVGLACSAGTPAETRAPEIFPGTDLVFTSSKGIGFVNADGSDRSSLSMTTKMPYGMENQIWRPVITGDDRALIVKIGDKFEHVYALKELVLWKAGELPVPCLQWQAQQMAYLSANQQQIFIQTKQGTARYNLSSCGTNDAPIETYDGILGIPSPDLQYIASVDELDDPRHNRAVVVRDMESGETQVVGEGNYPAWSRDSQWLAYTGPDGIYAFNVETDIQPRRVIFYPNLFDEQYPTYFGAAPWRIPPEVSWSPDGKWLVYHKWVGTDYNTGIDPSSNTIYKLDIETGEETEIIDHGMYPSWRWPVEEP